VTRACEILAIEHRIPWYLAHLCLDRSFGRDPSATALVSVREYVVIGRPDGAQNSTVCTAASPMTVRNCSQVRSDLLMRDGDHLRREPLVERKAALSKLLIRSRGGIQYVEHAEATAIEFEALCKLKLRASCRDASARSIARSFIEGVDKSQKPKGASGNTRA